MLALIVRVHLPVQAWSKQNSTLTVRSHVQSRRSRLCLGLGRVYVHQNLVAHRALADLQVMH